MYDAMTVVLFAIAGALLGSIVGCIPGVHLHGGMAPLFAAGLCPAGVFAPFDPPSGMVPFVAGLVVAYAIVNTLPAIFLAAPAESALLVVLPGQKYLAQGRGYEGAMITAVGSLAGLFALILIAGPLAPFLIPPIHHVLSPHAHWVPWCLIGFILMSESPAPGTMGQGGWSKAWRGWIPPLSGMATFVLAGALGLILFYRSPLAPDATYRSLLPAFVGLFTLPQLILHHAQQVEIPRQTTRLETPLLCFARPGTTVAFLTGSIAGIFGGGFAAFFPGVTGAMGGFLAQHAAVLRSPRTLLIAQGASKLVYYAGGLLFLFVPGLHLVRSDETFLPESFYAVSTYHEYFMILGSIAVAGATSLLLVSPLSRFAMGLINCVTYRRLSRVILFILVGMVVALSGPVGLTIMLTGTGIGLMPILFGSRRINCLGVILLPMACRLSGIGPLVATHLGLM